MEKLDLNSLTKEQIAMAAQCKTPEELIELAKKTGMELSIEQAQAYLDELENVELDKAAMEKIAGGCAQQMIKCKNKKLNTIYDD